MIVLVDMPAPAPFCGETVSLADLPAPDAAFLAACVRVGRAVSLPDAVEWLRAVRKGDARRPVALVADVGDEVLFDVLKRDLGARVYSSHDAHQNPSRIVRELRDASIIPAILEQLERVHGKPDEDFRPVVRTIAVAGAAGRTLTGLCGRSGLYRVTLYRQFERAGWPPPGKVWSHARAWAVALRVANGSDIGDALLQSGWYSVKDYRRAAGRLEWPIHQLEGKH